MLAFFSIHSNVQQKEIKIFSRTHLMDHFLKLAARVNHIVHNECVKEVIFIGRSLTSNPRQVIDVFFSDLIGILERR